MKSASYGYNAAGRLELKLDRYLDSFGATFEHFVVLRDANALPDVLSSTLRQFFESVSSFLSLAPLSCAQSLTCLPCRVRRCRRIGRLKREVGARGRVEVEEDERGEPYFARASLSLSVYVSLLYSPALHCLVSALPEDDERAASPSRRPARLAVARSPLSPRSHLEQQHDRLVQPLHHPPHPQQARTRPPSSSSSPSPPHRPGDPSRSTWRPRRRSRSCRTRRRASCHSSCHSRPSTSSSRHGVSSSSRSALLPTSGRSSSDPAPPPPLPVRSQTRARWPACRAPASPPPPRPASRARPHPVGPQAQVGSRSTASTRTRRRRRGPAILSCRGCRACAQERARRAQGQAAPQAAAHQGGARTTAPSALPRRQARRDGRQLPPHHGAGLPVAHLGFPDHLDPACAARRVEVDLPGRQRRGPAAPQVAVALRHLCHLPRRPDPAAVPGPAGHRQPVGVGQHVRGRRRDRAVRGRGEEGQLPVRPVPLFFATLAL